MNKILNKLKKPHVIDTICFVVTTIWIIFSFWNDFHFFDFSYTKMTSYFISSGNPNSIIFYIILKILFIGLMYAFSSYISYCIKGVLRKDKKIIELVKIYLLLLLVYGIVLLFIYPGIWFNNGRDELQLFEFSRRLQVQYHQGVLTSILYILALMIYPRPVFVVMLQLLIGTLLLGNIILDISKKSKVGKILFFILVFSPAALYYANYPLRSYLFAVFFLAFLHYFMKYRNEPKISLSNLYFLTFLCCVIINFRIEALVLVFLFPFLFIKKIPLKHIIYSTMILICSVFMCSLINKIGFQHAYRSHNSLTFVAPIGLYIADESRHDDSYEDDLKIIDKVYNAELLKEKAATNFIDAPRKDEEYTEEDYKKFLNTTVKILIHNPDLFFYQKFTEAAHSLGITSLSFANKILGTTEYSRIGTAFPKKLDSKIIQSKPYFGGFDIESHNLFTRIIGGQFKILKTKAYDIFYAFWLPCIALIAVAIFAIIKKNKILLTADSLILLHLFLIILTAPSRYQMYYFAEYLIGWYMIILIFSCYCQKNKKRKN